MRVGQKRIEIIQGTKDRIDVGVVADIVAEIRHWRRIDRRNPDGVHAEPLQIVESAPNADEITNAIAVAVHKRAWIDLIDDAALPPSKICELRIGVIHLKVLFRFDLYFRVLDFRGQWKAGKWSSELVKIPHGDTSELPVILLF